MPSQAETLTRHRRERQRRDTERRRRNAARDLALRRRNGNRAVRARAGSRARAATAERRADRAEERQAGRDAREVAQRNRADRALERQRQHDRDSRDIIKDREAKDAKRAQQREDDAQPDDPDEQLVEQEVRTTGTMKGKRIGTIHKDKQTEAEANLGWALGHIGDCLFVATGDLAADPEWEATASELEMHLMAAYGHVLQAYPETFVKVLKQRGEKE